MLFKSKVDNLHKFAYISSIYVLYISYFCLALGLFPTHPEYIYYLNLFVRLYSSIFLLIRFNPYRNITYTEFDKNLV
jgi:hypothetical protein